jgi:hypothetical protein
MNVVSMRKRGQPKWNLMILIKFNSMQRSNNMEFYHHASAQNYKRTMYIQRILSEELQINKLYISTKILMCINIAINIHADKYN